MAFVKQHQVLDQRDEPGGERGDHIRNIFTGGSSDCRPDDDRRRWKRLFRGGTETILLVEDDDAVRFMTRRTLEGCGYKVVEAASGRKALAIWPSNASRKWILLPSRILSCPTASTVTVLREMLCEQVLALKVIFVSGYNLNRTDPLATRPFWPEATIISYKNLITCTC